MESFTVSVWEVVGSFEEDAAWDTEGAGTSLALDEDATETWEGPASFLAPRVFSDTYKKNLRVISGSN